MTNLSTIGSHRELPTEELVCSRYAESQLKGFVREGLRRSAFGRVRFLFFARIENKHKCNATMG